MADLKSSTLPATKEEFVDLLRLEPHRITFIKADGSERKMLATLDPELMPSEHEAKKTDQAKVLHAQRNNSFVNVFDMEAEGWRSFRIDSVRHFEKA